MGKLSYIERSTLSYPTHYTIESEKMWEVTGSSNKFLVSLNQDMYFIEVTLETKVTPKLRTVKNKISNRWTKFNLLYRPSFKIFDLGWWWHNEGFGRSLQDGCTLHGYLNMPHLTYRVIEVSLFWHQPRTSPLSLWEEIQ